MSAFILSTRVDETTYEDACQYIYSLVEKKQNGYIVAANVHVVMTAYWNLQYRKIVDNAELVVSDGMPLVLGLKWLGCRTSSRVYGPDLMHFWCKYAASIGSSIYFYGGSVNTLKRLSKNIKESFPSLKIVGMHSPPFRPLTKEEEDNDLNHINESGADVVFVGLGCPKQEEWMYRNRDKTSAVMVGVGAAFRFHSGEVNQAPRWLMKLSMEWLFRLIQEPRRLWSRYLITNSAFVVLFSIQLIKYHLNRAIR
ncbi:MAG: WecB/TagA/CpsF family glycosyltransferase [Cyanobacteria bacterium P01_D01_bin.105]